MGGAIGLMRAVLRGAIATAALACLPGVAGASPVAGIGLYELGGSLSSQSHPQDSSLVIGDASDAALLARLPGRSLVYFSGTDVNTQWSTGVPYGEAARNDWLLRGGSGSLLVNSGYPDNYVGDVGNPAYQRAWLANVSTFLRRHHDKGVFVDDVLRDLTPLTGSEAAKYPTQSSWARAQLAFVRAVGGALRREGYYVLVNASGYIPGDPGSDDGVSTLAWWRQLAPSVDGLMNEYFEQIPDGSDALRSSGATWNQNWDGWERLVQGAESMGKDFIGVAYGAAGDTAVMSYGKASFLLDWNGGGSVYIFQTADGSDPVNGAWTSDIGKPTSPKKRVGSGWLRRYSDGVAIVNPSPTRTQKFELGGAYIEGDRAVSTVLLAPTSGLVLHSAAA